MGGGGYREVSVSWATTLIVCLRLFIFFLSLSFIGCSQGPLPGLRGLWLFGGKEKKSLSLVLEGCFSF